MAEPPQLSPKPEQALSHVVTAELWAPVEQVIEESELVRQLSEEYHSSSEYRSSPNFPKGSSFFDHELSLVLYFALGLLLPVATLVHFFSSQTRFVYVLVGIPVAAIIFCAFLFAMTSFITRRRIAVIAELLDRLSKLD